jgi:hypothetical protein
MIALDDATLKAVSVEHGIDYTPIETKHAHGIATKMSRVFKLSKSQLFAKIANLKDHTRLFSHLTALNVIKSSEVANVIGKNQFVIVEGLAEGGAKLGVKLVTLTPDDKIECELFTDLFKSAKSNQPLHNKKGSIVWDFEEIDPCSTKMTVESDFETPAETPYVRGSVDHVWMDFFENVMVDTRELTPAKKRTAPFGPRSELKIKDMERLHQLETENEKLRRAVADLALEVQRMKEVRGGS